MVPRPRQHNSLHHPLLTVVQTFRSSGTSLGVCRSTLLVAIDGFIYGGRSGATQIRPNNSAPVFAGELLTGFSHSENKGGNRASKYCEFKSRKRIDSCGADACQSKRWLCCRASHAPANTSFFSARRSRSFNLFGFPGRFLGCADPLCL